MSLGGTTGDNTRLLGRAPEEEEEEAMQAEGVREVAVATGLEVLYQETPNYRGAAAEADRMIEPRETARHAWRVPDLGVEPDVSADSTPPPIKKLQGTSPPWPAPLPTHHVTNGPSTHHITEYRPGCTGCCAAADEHAQHHIT
ncbi:unnamed protein product [Closterium sp. NIES-64]|nr:unnamed protein product [Closterium sp. NIES-64]